MMDDIGKDTLITASVAVIVIPIKWLTQDSILFDHAIEEGSSNYRNTNLDGHSSSHIDLWRSQILHIEIEIDSFEYLVIHSL